MDSKTKNLALKTLEFYRNQVWAEIQKYLKSPDYPNYFKIQKKYKDLEKFHWELAKEYPLRKGKYLRPTLLMLTAKATGAGDLSALKTAAAMQLSEEWILVHDDIEDGSLLRRGKPTLHKMYNIGLAVNAGDTLQSVMWKVVVDNISLMGIAKAQEIFDELYSIITRTELGQTVEMFWFSEGSVNFSDEDWYFVCDSKSSYYSIAGPIRLGAIVAGCDAEQMNLLTEFGVQLGRCWQLVDDILDVTSDFSGRKQKGNDIFEGKRTLILGHLLRSASVKDRIKINKIMGEKRDKKKRSEVRWIIDKMATYGSIEYAKKLAQMHNIKCKALFDKMTFFKGKEEREKMNALIDFILERDY